MKKLLLLAMLFPSVCMAEVMHPNNPDISQISTFSGTGEATVDGVQSYCSKADAVFDYDNSVEIHFSCGINSVMLLGSYDSLSDNTTVKINSIETDSVYDAEGNCIVTNQGMSCYGKNDIHNEFFKFKVISY